MPSLSDLARRHTRLTSADVEWLHALVSDWQLIADLSFADLVLWAPLRTGPGWLALAQMRPTTGPTAVHDDVVGHQIDAGEQPLLDAAMAGHRICREGDPDWTSGVPVRAETIPVTRLGEVIAVIERNTNLSAARTPSRLELTYLRGADDLARMVAEGTFPFEGAEPILVRSPRVGDGLLQLDGDGRVTYASPNALSAYRRLGLTADLVGAGLGPVTARLRATDEPMDDSLMIVASGRRPGETEVEANGSIVQLRAIPLAVAGGRTGALLLLRDVTELRRRERELLSKDATIREIHHRVKNNLQTVAALLRLQARRLSEPKAREALEEAVRRVGSIAVVHETLSFTPDEVVDFDDIASRVTTMAVEVSAPALTVIPRFTGTFGRLPASVATPLAMVLTELVQNALEHGLHPFAVPDPDAQDRAGAAQATLEVHACRRPGRLIVTVDDSGVGLPPDFDLYAASSLGLQIVRTLVVSELNGRLELTTRPTGGTQARLDIPVEAAPRPDPAETPGPGA